MSLAESRGQLGKSYRDLWNRWEHVKSSWSDTQAETLEKQYLLQIETQVRKTLAAMDHMNIVLQRTIKDCE